MKRKVIWWFVYFVAITGVAINLGYSIEHLMVFFEPEQPQNLREAIAAAAALELGWVVLLVWFMFYPQKRRAVLLLALVPMLGANVLYGFILEAGVGANPLFGLFYAGLYVAAYYLLAPKQETSVTDIT
jgi:hypothetical protein